MVLVEQEVLHEPADGIGPQLCISIDAHHIFRVGVGDTIVQCRSLAAIGFAQDMHFVIAVKGLMDALQGMVLTAVVDKDDVERGIVLAQKCLDGAHAVDLLVVGGYDD